eukprot:gnl/MRDRNA2_/MRDRNA2_81598_c0_seq2.p1 gnl/MRDRNA2_/MRDRNA2_81598_c0~~gnl/MRDRNA2_/MRDRNA2_81598_c0_seq2.p1  ORF type:complete len:207 (+),score=34.07 gnl/MRDRNA2_/MRDRNA2_81598_c0_seq2:62-622(+)
MASDTSCEVELSPDDVSSTAFEVELPTGRNIRSRLKPAWECWTLCVAAIASVGALFYVTGNIRTLAGMVAPFRSGVVQTAPAEKSPNQELHLPPTVQTVPLISASYWDTGRWKMLGPNDTPFTKQFKCKEKRNFFGYPKEYKFELEQYEDPKTGKEITDDIDKKVMTIEPHFFTFYGHCQQCHEWL